VLAEWSDCRPAYDSPDAVACLAGAAPVTRRSGTHPSVSFGWACNKRFHKAITTLADNSHQASPWAAKVYADAIARGLDIPTPSAGSPGRGSGCSGAAGSTKSPTTPAATATPTR
jgi:hypothetical protein